MAKKSKKDKKQQKKKGEYSTSLNRLTYTPEPFPGTSVQMNPLLAEQLGEPFYTTVESHTLKEALEPDLSRFLEIQPPKTYTEEEYRKLAAKIEVLQRDLKKANQKWKREHPRELRRQSLLRYFHPATADAIVKGEIQLRTGRRCEMTILSCDIRDFTKFTNEVDPEYLTELLNNYLVKCTEIIQRHGGAVDKYSGDGILAYFGCLNAGEDHAVNACEAATQIIENQDSIFRGWYEKLLETPEDKYLGIGIGIASGFAYWDYIGTPIRRELTIVGRHVNLASRLQSKAKGGEVLISNITKGKLKSRFECEKVEGDITMQGFAGNIDVFQLKKKIADKGNKGVQGKRRITK